MLLSFREQHEYHKEKLVASEDPLQFKRSVSIAEQIAYCLNDLLLNRQDIVYVKPVLIHLAKMIDYGNRGKKTDNAQSVYNKIEKIGWSDINLNSQIATVVIALGKFFNTRSSKDNEIFAQAGISKILVNHVHVEQDPQVKLALLNALSVLVSQSEAHCEAIRKSNIDIVKILLPLLNAQTVMKENKKFLIINQEVVETNMAVVFVLASFIKEITDDTDEAEYRRAIGAIYYLGKCEKYVQHELFCKKSTQILMGLFRSGTLQNKQLIVKILCKLALSSQYYRAAIEEHDITNALLSLLLSDNKDVNAEIAIFNLFSLSIRKIFNSWPHHKNIFLRTLIYHFSSALTTLDKTGSENSIRNLMSLIINMTECDRSLNGFYSTVLPLLVQLDRMNINKDNTAYLETLAQAIASVLGCLGTKDIKLLEINHFLYEKLQQPANEFCRQQYMHALNLLPSMFSNSLIMISKPIFEDSGVSAEKMKNPSKKLKKN